MQTSQLAVNPEKLINNLRFSFTQSTTVLGELMQNARRAGATFVSFEYAEASRTLTVCDDGCGIESLQTLLTVAESGWDVELIETEHAFGVGFLSALFACETISVDSKGGRFSVNTADLLAFQPIMIEPADWKGITRLTLTQFKPETDRIVSQLCRLARGFPIEVRFNGASLERLRAITSALPFIETELGDLCLYGLSPGEDWLLQTDYFHLYLQGLPVYHSHHERDPGHVIHLDTRRFFARLPDRDKLIDEAQVIAEVKRVLQREARNRLATLKSELSAEDFVEGYDTLKTYHCLDLLNEVPLLPKQALAVIQEYPIKEGCGNVNLAMNANAVSRSDVESGLIKIAELDDLEDVGALRWMFAWHRDYLVFRPGLDQGHWLFQYLIDLNTPAITLDVVGEKHSAYFEGQWVSGQAIFCEQYRLTMNGESVDIDNDAVYDEDQNCFIVPSKETTGMVVGQASSYHDEWDTYMEAAKEAEEWDFQNFVVANTADQAADALQRLLPSFGSCPALFSRVFQVALGDSGEVVSVAEIQANGAMNGQGCHSLQHPAHTEF
ncbi:MAG: hypothetical protein BVN35_22370 [Proteobacteria bacterium ST_bin11]|nr:MAG: hypothetical protein BVN35_22370 [Proteobacteria bacterium ST_bin11]